MNNDSKIVSEILLKIKSVTFNSEKPFKYASGILSPVYIDCRILMSYPTERNIIRDLYIKKINSIEEKFDVIAGTATAGIPHAAWIAEKLNLPMIYVRGKAKDHGKGNQIEGIISNGQKIAVIEDLISTGESSCETTRAIRNTGGISNHVFSIFTYNMNSAYENFKENKIKNYSLTSFEDTVSTAGNLKNINEKQKKIILEWTLDPKSWGKKMGFE